MQADGRQRREAAFFSKTPWEGWLELWNGNLDNADAIVAPSFVARFDPLGDGPDEVRGPEGLKRWIGGSLAAFTNHVLTGSIDPLAQGNLIVGRWVFRAVYRGGMQRAFPAAVGERVEYAGIDILRVESGKIVEYWLCADVLQVLRLGVGGSSLNRVHFLQPDLAIANDEIGDQLAT